MRSAWAKRRSSFDATPTDCRSLLAAAKQELTEASELSRSTGGATYAQAIHLLANVEVDLDEPGRARRLWEEAIAILRTTDDVLELAHKLRHLGDLHHRAERLAAAAACYDESLLIYREHTGPGSLDFANAVSRAAELQERLGERAEAARLWRETRDLYASVNLPAGVEQAERRLQRLR